MIKLIAFDLDDTLAPTNKATPDDCVQLLRKIEDCGIKIAVCSGKPTFYLSGYLRQIGLKNPILIGENGAVIQFGDALPPKEYYKLPYSDAAENSLKLIKALIDEKYPNMWYQPNETVLTPFTENAEHHAYFNKILIDYADKIKDVTVFKSFNAYDFLPNNINKQTALKYLKKIINIDAEQILAVGNSNNDYPMFQYAKYAIGIDVPDNSKVNKNFNTLKSALLHIIDFLNLNINYSVDK